MRLALHRSERDIVRPCEEPLPQRSGFGRALIEKALPYALDARTRFELGETTLHCSIDPPLTDRRESAGRRSPRKGQPRLTRCTRACHTPSG